MEFGFISCRIKWVQEICFVRKYFYMLSISAFDRSSCELDDSWFVSAHKIVVSEYKNLS